MWSIAADVAMHGATSPPIRRVPPLATCTTGTFSLPAPSVRGLPMTEAMRRAREHGVLERLPLFDRLTGTGAVWADGRTVEADTVLYATGFRAAVDHLAPLKLREPGGGIRMEGTRAVRDPRIHLVGYGPSASTIGANRAGRAAVRDVRWLLEEDAGVGAAGVGAAEVGAAEVFLPASR